MAKKNIIFEVHKDEQEPIMPEKPSQIKAKRLAIIEAYKKQNPWKYEMKKAALDKWMNEV